MTLFRKREMTEKPIYYRINAFCSQCSPSISKSPKPKHRLPDSSIPPTTNHTVTSFIFHILALISSPPRKGTAKRNPKLFRNEKRVADKTRQIEFDCFDGKKRCMHFSVLERPDISVYGRRWVSELRRSLKVLSGKTSARSR